MLFVGKWGKAVDGHPLVYHLIDSAEVALLLWQEALTSGSRKQFSQWLGLTEEECGKLLSYWTSLHDLGKAAPSFQEKHAPTQAMLQARGFHFPNLPTVDIRHHSLLSQWILEDYSSELSIQPVGIFNQFRYAIGGHHGSFNFQQDQEESRARDKNLGDRRWKAARDDLFGSLTALIAPPSPEVLKLSQPERNAFFNLLTGFFVAADWISSQDDLFHYHPPTLSLDEYRDRSSRSAHKALTSTGWIGWRPDDARPSFIDLFGFSPYPLQQTILDHAENLLHEPFLMIVEAPTGSGKTEAALATMDRAIQTGGLRGGYIAMPTQATSNQMFWRTKYFLERRFSSQKNVNLQLAHGFAQLNELFNSLRMAAVEDFEGSPEGSVNAMEWFMSRKRTLLAPFGVGTVDQAFFSVLRVRHSFLRLFGLHRKVVIFDEVHAYDTYMLEIFKQLLAWMRAIGSSVILLSATLPNQTRLDLLRAFQPAATIVSETAAYPRLSSNDGRVITTISLGDYPDRTVQLGRLLPDPMTWLEFLREKLLDGGCAAVICNTVDRAQQVFRQIRDAGLVPEGDLFLLHARMPFCWRERAEGAVLQRFGKLDRPATGPRRGIVVATQIIEQSLDLDFDLLITDLAPIDLLIQRIGRLHRHSGGQNAPQRPSSLAEPLCLICQPDAPSGDGLPEFGKDRFVYAPAILQRTYFVLQPLQSLLLPADSDELINTVYSSEPLAACTDLQNQEIQHLFQEMINKQDQAAVKAGNRLVGDVDCSNVLGMKTAYLRDDDPSVEQEAQSLTRDILQPSVQLVCFVIHDGQPCLLDELYPCRPDQNLAGPAVLHALRSMVSVSKQEVVKYFRGRPRHEAWKNQPALRHAYPVVFEDGKCSLGDRIELILDELAGLTVE